MMARMKLGQIVATRGVVGLMRENNDFAAFVHRSFQRYLRADWGELCESDRKQNDRALAHGGDRIKRLRTVDDPAFESAMALYAASFPPHEQRLEPSQRRIMAHEQYHFGILHDEEGFAGLALFWDAGAYPYVEHLCISPARRGKGLGTAALDLFAEAGKPVVLEIDPPVDAVSCRRQNFYERVGFTANPHPHIHPPYRPENSGHALVVMSRPRPLTEDEYTAFAAYLAGVVMKDCQKP